MRARHLPLLLLAACAPHPGERLLFPDAGPAPAVDAGSIDAGPADAGVPDAGPVDDRPQGVPGPPRNLVAEADPAQGYRIHVRWDPPDDAGAAPLAGYVVTAGTYAITTPTEVTDLVLQWTLAEDTRISAAAVNALGQGEPAWAGPVHTGVFGHTWAIRLSLGYPYYNTRWPMAVADFDGDGLLDVVLWADPVPLLLRGLPHGRLDAPQPAAAPDARFNSYERRLAVADLDGDGLPDLVSSTLYLRNLGGTFAVAEQLPYDGRRWAVGDFNGDGISDLFAVRESPSLALEVRLGGPGGLGPAWSRPYAQAYPYPGKLEFAAAGDFDGDGQVDALISYTSGSELLPGLGDGTLGPGRLVHATAWDAATHAEVGDLDRDGRADVMLGFSTVWLGAPDGGLTQFQGQPYFCGTISVFGDFNGDGRTDLAADRVFLGLPGGRLEEIPGVVSSGACSGATPFAVGDFDGDGRDDLVQRGYLPRPDGGSDQAILIHYGR